jgi:hypothetical protein
MKIHVSFHIKLHTGKVSTNNGTLTIISSERRKKEGLVSKRRRKGQWSV